MKTICLSFFLLAIYFQTAAQQKELELELHIDTCSYYKTVLNTQDTSFNIRFKNSSSILPLFKKDEVEIGIKVYANQIIEDSDTTTIVRYIFYNKEDGRWNRISESEYIPLSDLGNARSLNVGSDQKISHFYVRYYFSVDFSLLKRIIEKKRED